MDGSILDNYSAAMAVGSVGVGSTVDGAATGNVLFTSPPCEEDDEGCNDHQHENESSYSNSYGKVPLRDADIIWVIQGLQKSNTHIK